MVEPSLRYTALIGNAYSGCVFVSLLGVLDGLQEHDSGSADRHVLVRLGRVAEMLSGTVAPDARGRMARHRIEAALGARHEISVDEWMRPRRPCSGASPRNASSPIGASRHGAIVKRTRDRGLLVLDRVQNHFRTYVRS
jgi:3-hydroxy-3-methylglutaryl CoA synthase